MANGKVLTTQMVLEFVGNNPGCVTGDVAKAFKVTSKQASNRLCSACKPTPTGERLKRIEQFDAHNFKSLRWYLPQDLPQEFRLTPEELAETQGASVEAPESEPEPEIVAEAAPTLEPEAQMEPESESAGPGTFTVSTLLDYVAAHPGCDSGTIGEVFGLNGTQVASRLLSVYKGRNKNRLDRVPFKRPNGPTIYRWYIPKDLPQEVIEERARLAEAERAREEAERLAKREAKILAKQQRDAEELAAQQAEAEALAEAEAEAIAGAAITEAQNVLKVPALAPSSESGEAIREAMDECVKRVTDIVMAEFSAKLELAIAAQMKVAFQQVPTRFEQQKPEAYSAPEIVKASDKFKRPKIVVVGLKEAQTHFVRAKFDQDFDLEFFPNDCNPSRLSDKLTYADQCFLMTDKISHKHKDIVVKSQRPYVYVSGGLTSLTTNLKAAIHVL